jgi:6,7-dimethyl-8-ribityllumazine synthase
MGYKTTLLRTCYATGKSIISGAPMAVVCVNAVRQCSKDIINEDLPSLACKVVLHYCVPSMTVVSFIGAYGTPETAKKLKFVGKFVVNSAGLIVTGPTYLADRTLTGFEIAVFGEAIPISSGSLYLLD